MNILRFSFMLVILTFTSFPIFSAPLKIIYILLRVI